MRGTRLVLTFVSLSTESKLFTSAMSSSVVNATEILNSNASLTNKLYQILAKEEGNVFFSPLGIHLILSVLYQGAQEETEKVLTEVLEVKNAKSLALGYKNLLNTIPTTKELALKIASKIYMKQSLKLNKKFAEISKKHFQVDTELVDFLKRSKAVKKMNEWVSKNTQNKIKNIMDEEMINEMTTVVLINAIYFKSDWSEHFWKEVTEDRLFFLDDGSSVEVQMMRDTRQCLYKYDENLEAHLVQIPYVAEDISMVIILPKEEKGIKKLEANLAKMNLSTLTREMTDYYVSLCLPKFKMEQNMNLKHILSEIGLSNIFDKNTADFRQIFEQKENESFFVDKFIQKTFIEVNEKGTEAGAVTVCTIMPCCERYYPEVTVEVNHPAIFMLVITQNDVHNILFCGRLSRPSY